MKSEAKVGIFVFLGLVFLFLLTTQVNKFKTFSKKGYTLYSNLSDVAGLEENSKVKVNGIEAGYVKHLSIDKNSIKAEFFIYDDVRIPKDSTIKLMQGSMLGGKFAAITLGKSDEVLGENERLKNDKALADFNSASDSIDAAAKEFKLFISEFREIMDTKSRQNLRETFANLESITAELKKFAKFNTLNTTVENFNNMAVDLSGAGKKFGLMSDKFSHTADIINNKLPEIIKKLDSMIASFESVGTDVKKDIPQILEKFSKIEDDIDKVIEENKKPLNSTLVNASSFFDTGGETFEKLGEYLNALEEVKLEVAMRGEYMADDEYAKNYFSLHYVPNDSRYYMLDIASMDDYSRLDDSGNLIEPTKHEKSNILISAQMGKRYKDIVLRGGIIENSGGAGIDYYLLNDKLKTSFEMFDFNAENDVRGENPHAKFSIRYTLLKHLDAYLGYDNFLNSKSKNFMLGFGIHFVDDDLKKLLASQSLGSFAK